LAALRQVGHYFTTVSALQDKGLKNIGKSLTPEPIMHRQAW
jgi:hypothetical protein